MLQALPMTVPAQLNNWLALLLHAGYQYWCCVTQQWNNKIPAGRIR
jgi:hypothetical protein